MSDEHTDDSLPPLTFVLGGARSGKSAFAEKLVGTSTRPVYVATAEALDDEMAEKIRVHRARRGAHWLTVEEPLDIVTVLEHHAEPGSAVLLDCLTLWLSNLLHAGRDVDTQSQLLLESLATLKGPVVIVSNEVGLGVTPNNALSRRYLDHLGQLHQQIAAQAARVYFLVAGIATLIKHT
jgi:adenosylcobinamide kinase/adenosylcobinamide-phosphate guanylyltransferase